MSKTYAVFGMGRFGRSVAKTLYNNGAEVLIADSEQEKVNDMADFSTYAATVNLTDEDSIKELDLSSVDVLVVAMARNLQASIMCTMVAKEAGVPFVLVKVYDNRMGEILLKCGADQVIQVEEEAGVRAAMRLNSGDLLDYFDLDNDLFVANIHPKADWIGSSLRALRLREKYNINVVAIKENGRLTSKVDPEAPLTKDQELLVVVDEEGMSRIK